jgi:hypothetical protein
VGRKLCGIDVHEEVYGRRAVDLVHAHLPEHVWVTVPAPTAGEVPASAGARRPAGMRRRVRAIPATIGG